MSAGTARAFLSFFMPCGVSAGAAAAFSFFFLRKKNPSAAIICSEGDFIIIIADRPYGKRVYGRFFCLPSGSFLSLSGRRFRVCPNGFSGAVFLSVRINAVRVRSHYFVVSVLPLSDDAGSSGCVGVGCSDFAASTVLAAESPSLYEAEASTVTRSPTLNSAARLERVAAV